MTLRDDNLAPIPGVAVTFDAVATDSLAWLPSLYLTRDTTHYNWSGSVAGTTDADGRVQTALRLGCTVGAARVRIRAPAEQVDTTLVFSVVPAKAVGVQLLPSDTALMQTHTVSLRGGVVDQCGNTRPEPVTVTVDGFAALQDPAKLMLIGSTVGVAHVIATAADGRSDTATITVVPTDVVAGFRETVGIVAMNLDGSNYRVVRPNTASSYFTQGISWGPGNALFVGDCCGAPSSRLGRITSAGVSTFLFPGDNLIQNYPRTSSDGQWIYFARGSSASSEIWRAHPDGSLPARVGPANTASLDLWPWPSPDGTRVVFSRQIAGVTTLWMLTGFAGQAANIGVTCVTPSWSPDGARLACLSITGTLQILQPDGTVMSSYGLTASTTGIAWSSNSRHVVIARNSALALVDAQTGAMTPVPFTTSWSQPSLRAYP